MNTDWKKNICSGNLHIGKHSTHEANGPGDLDSILGRIIPKTLEIVFDTSLSYVSRVKWSNSRKGVVPSPTPRCSSY